jgi:competence protein ComEC
MSFSAAVGFYFLASSAVALSIAVLILSLVMLCLFRVLASFNMENRLLQITAVCAAAFSAGLMLGICAAGAGRTDVHFGLDTGRITAVEGVLLEDPRIISGGKAVVSLSLRRCAAEGGIRASSKGEITVFFPHENAGKLREFGRGASVFAEGDLRLTNRQGAFETGWTFSADSLHVVRPAPIIERMRTGIRLSLIKRFDGKNWGGLALALLLGIKDNLDTNLAVLYRNAGCSYILALSGMHLAVLAALIAFFLRKPLGLKAASVAGAAVILRYCFIVGPMPSLNRAALMYLLGTAAVLGALPKKPLSILSLSFLIHIVISPAAGYSVSFILSYLALAGILILSPFLYSLFAGKVPDFILRPLSVSCGAFLAAAGVTGFSFAIIVPMGIITGLALVPLTTVFMTGSLVWLVFDFFSLSNFLNMPLSLLYRLMESIVTFAGKVPGISAGRPSFILTLSLVLMLLIAIFEYIQRTARLKLQPFD